MSRVTYPFALMSQLLSLPPELVSEVTTHLVVLEDLKAFSLVSSAARQLVLRSIFCNIRISPVNRSIKEAYDELNSAGTVIKHAIQYGSHVTMAICAYRIPPIYKACGGYSAVAFSQW